MSINNGLIYFYDGELIASHNMARVYTMSNDLYLEIGIGHNLWAFSGELDTYIWQMQDYPCGDCLEIGLGLGVATKYLLSFPHVRSLETVEINKDVIEVQRQSNKINDTRHSIINDDGLHYLYSTDKMFDFIFVDCYKVIDEETLPLITDIASGCRRVLRDGGKVIGWADDATPEYFIKPFYKLFD